MDANQTRFHLVLGADWHDARASAGDPDPSTWRRVPATFDDPCDLVFREGFLTLNRSVTLVRARATDTAADPALRTGAVRDRHGNTYVVEGTGIRLRVCTDDDDGVGDWFWQGSTPLSGLALTDDDLLVVGRPTDGDVVIFDLLAGGTPVSIPGPLGFAPYDLVGVGSDVYILDRAALLVYALRLVLPPAPAPVLPGLEAPAVVTTAGFRTCAVTRGTLSALLDIPFPLTGAADAVAIEWHPAGEVLILDPAFGVRGWREGVAGLTEPWTGLQLDAAADAPPLSGHDMVRVETDEGWVLFVVEAQGNQAFAFDLAGDPGAARLDHRAELLPLRRYLGVSLIAGAGDAFYASEGRWAPIVVLDRPRWREEAELRLPVVGAVDPEEGWDGGVNGCVWHRVLLDGCFPGGVRIDLWSRCSDDRARFADPSWGWRKEPPLVARTDGSELPFDTRGLTTIEALLQAASGRYLQLRLVLQTDLRSTARIEALRVYYPRFSYLDRYLPAVWREDPTSADFVGRFLANPEGVFTTIEDRVAQAHRLFDPALTSAEWLPWLAGWLGVVFDSAWTEPKRRFFLQNAVTFFRARGTRRGVLAAIRMVLYECASLRMFEELHDGVALLEGFGRRPRTATPADISTWAHRFTIVLPRPAPDVVAADAGFAERQRSVVRRVVELEAPSHTTFDIVYADLQFRLGESRDAVDEPGVRVGIDTILAPSPYGPPDAHVLDVDALATARLGTPYPVLPRSPDGQMSSPTPLPEPT